jgi:actin-related protein
MEDSVQQKILDAVMGCSIDNRSSIMANVMVTGGNTMFEGLPQVN